MNLFSSPDKGSRKISADLYENLDEGFGSRRSAREVIPLVLEIIQPQSVIDVGCGVGSWLAVFQEFGLEDFLGVDVDYIDKKIFKIPEDKYLPFDLKKPLKLDRQFDLVMCLEMAAYLPSECAEILVNSLTELGSVVLFSSAVPFQDNPEVQVNQQWPEYWVNFFQQKGYVVIDCLREKIWKNQNISWWFSQNMLLFVKQDYLESHERLKRELENTRTAQLSLVHPQMYMEQHTLLKPERRVRDIVAELGVATTKTLKRRFGG
jgi:SAM-dependent methyltransferase